jgi:hypothetical protein
MADKSPNSPDVAAQQNAAVAKQPFKRKHRGLWILLLVFLFFVVIVFLNAPRDTINWIEDYNEGIELAKLQNKPALLCFFKYGSRYSSEIWETVYNSPDVQKYVEDNFIPILIDVDKQPEIASRYKVDYYPTHYVENPNTNEIDGPFIGSSHLLDFIKQPRKYTPKDDVLR